MFVHVVVAVLGAAFSERASKRIQSSDDYNSCISDSAGWLADQTAEALCSQGRYEEAAKQKLCIEDAYRVLSEGNAQSRDPEVLKAYAATLCKKSRFNATEVLPLAKCFLLADGNRAAGFLEAAECMKASWRASSGCNDLFGPVKGEAGIVFIVDTSGSMKEEMPEGGSRMDLMKSELTSVLESLTERQNFTILAFSTFVATFSQGLTPATSVNVQSAISWVQGLSAKGNTDYERPIRQALAVAGVSAVYFLSDGQPTESCKEASCLPLAGSVPVHTTLLMPGTDTPAREKARTVLYEIADRTGGVFREPYAA